MVICKFFLEGRCKFGNDCNFEHTNNRYSNENSYRHNQSHHQPQQQNRHQSQYQSHQPQKYFNQSNHHQPAQQSRQQYFNQQQSVVQPSRFGGHQPSGAPLASQSVDYHEPNAESYIKLVIEDAVSADVGRQYLFSCYAPLLRRVINKNQDGSTNPNPETLPGMEDYSPEELLWGWKESQLSGQSQEFMAKFELLKQTQEKLRKALTHPDKPTSHYIILVERGIPASTAGTAFGSSPNLQVALPSQPSASSFSFSLPNAQMPRPSAQPVFGFQQPVAGPPATSFSFRLPSSTPAQPSGFGLLSQSQPAFGVPTQPATAFRFAVNTTQPTAAQTAHSPFQKLAGAQTLPSINNFDSSLSSSDLEKYRADKFEFGKIPRAPPPRNLC